jgi:hypothetical protein
VTKITDVAFQRNNQADHLDGRSALVDGSTTFIIRFVPKQGLQVGIASVWELKEGADHTELANIHPQDGSVD